MPIYCLLIDGEPVVVFGATDFSKALGFAADEFIRSELSYITHPDGRPLLAEGAEVLVRESLPEEKSAWDEEVMEAISGGEIRDEGEALDDMRFAFLIPYQDPV